MSPPEALTSFLQKKPLVLVTLGEKYRDPIEAKGELRDKLTIAIPHDELKGIRAPVLCLFQTPASQGTCVYVGVIQNKSPITDFETRITICHLKELTLRTFENLGSLLATGEGQNGEGQNGGKDKTGTGPVY